MNYVKIDNIFPTAIFFLVGLTIVNIIDIWINKTWILILIMILSSIMLFIIISLSFEKFPGIGFGKYIIFKTEQYLFVFQIASLLSSFGLLFEIWLLPNTIKNTMKISCFLPMVLSLIGITIGIYTVQIFQKIGSFDESGFSIKFKVEMSKNDKKNVNNI